MNGLEDRVCELRDTGREHLVEELLRASCQSANVEDVVDVDDDRIRVVRGRFRGEHDVVTGSDGRPTVDSRGRYRFVGDEIEVDVETRSLGEEDLRTIHAELRDDETDGPGAVAEEGNGEHAAVADGGRVEDGAGGVRSRLRQLLDRARP